MVPGVAAAGRRLSCNTPCVSIWSWLAVDAVKDDRLLLSPIAFLELGAGGLQVE